MPDSVTSIGMTAFNACYGLTNVVLPDSVTSITIPNSVTSIGNAAFEQCYALSIITFTGTREEWNDIKKGDRWDNDTGNYTIHCTDGDIAK